jgi:hypothetical protein
VWAWYLTVGDRDAGKFITKYYAPNLHGWRVARHHAQPFATQELAESRALLLAVNVPQWIGKIRVRRMKLEGEILAKWGNNLYKG